jgi:hypothetical protein
MPAEKQGQAILLQNIYKQKIASGVSYRTDYKGVNINNNW